MICIYSGLNYIIHLKQIMLRILLVTIICTLIAVSCNKGNHSKVNKSSHPDIEFYNLNCMIDLEEDHILSANGFHTFHYSNGLIKSEGNLSMGIPSGFWKFYYDNGHIQLEGNYTNGQLNGFWKAYWYNGNIREEGHYQYCEKQGFWKFYYPTINHQIHHEGNFHQGKQVNIWKSYDQSGELTCSTSFTKP